MKHSLPELLHKLLIYGAIALFVFGVIAFNAIDRLVSTKQYGQVSMQEETFAIPETPFKLPKAIDEGFAFSLEYPADGTFSILWATDFHLRRGPFSGRKETYALLDRAFTELKPDLTVITGDLLFSFDALGMLTQFATFMEKHKQKWAYCFGNHDGAYTHNQVEIAHVLKQFPHALFSPGPSWVNGYSNYPVVLTSDGNPVQALILLDSHDSRVYQDARVGPDYLYPSQIAWYTWVSEGLGGADLFAFMHIPLPEFRDLWESGTALGVKEERTVTVPLENSGLFDAVLQEGTTKAVFCGHDHLNDFFGPWKGIWLYYGRSASFGSYGSPSFAKGVKTITLHKDNAPFEVRTYTLDDLGRK